MMLPFLLWFFCLPVQILLFSAFLLVDTLRLLLFPRRAASDTTPPATGEGCSIVVLNWNGRHLLEESLPPLEKAVRFSGRDHEVIVVDNGSSDGSVGWLRTHHPWTRIVELGENLGFAEGNNRGVEAARHEIVVLLNNDMIVSPDFLPPLLEGFADPSVFAVTSQIFFPEGKRREETGYTGAEMARGYLNVFHGEVSRCHYTRRFLPVLWAGGGSSAFHRRRFLELGGFSFLFSPSYVEDTDLSYRAWRRGWKVCLAAESKVLHKHRSSSKTRFREPEIRAMIEQRKLWYLWKNYQLRSLIGHFALFPLNLTQKIGVRTYLNALTGLPAVLWSRLREPRRAISDRRLLRWTRRPISYLNDLFPDRNGCPSPDQPLRILVVSAYLPHLGQHGGAGRVFQLLSRVAREHQVSLVTFVETQRELQEAKRLEPYCHRIETVLRRHYEPVSPFPYEPFEEFNCSNFREKMQEVLAEEDFDVVHFEWTQMAQYADLIPHVPKLVTEIEVNYAAQESLIHVEPRLLRRIKRFYDALQTFNREMEMCRKVEKIVCVTDVDRDYLKGYVPAEKLEIVNTGVDTRYFTPGAEEATDGDALVYVGAFRHEPNVDAMLFFCREVFPSILDRRPQTRLYIVGSSPPPVIRDLGKNGNITVTGFVEDLREYYELAQVVVVPLRTGVGIRGKILEGWAAAKAMVATPLACLGIRAVHGENILIASEPEEFARWTLALLEHPEFCRRLGRAGRETAVKYYEWDSLGKQMSRLYQDAVSEYAAISRERVRKLETRNLDQP